MTTRVTFNFECCFRFEDDLTSSPIDVELVTQTTNDFVRFVRYVKAMVIEQPAQMLEPNDLPITRFIAISPGLRLETSGLPVTSGAAGYIREALEPLLAYDGALFDFAAGELPPESHYSLRIEDEAHLGALELREELVELREKVETLLEAVEGQGTPEGKTTKKAKTKKKTKTRTKKK